MHGLEALKSSGAFGTALPQVLRLTRKATPPHTDTLTHSHALSHPAPVSQTKVRWPRRAPKRRWPVRAPKEQPRHNQGTKSLDPKRASCWISVEPYPRRVSKSLSLVSGFTHTHPSYEGTKIDICCPHIIGAPWRNAVRSAVLGAEAWRAAGCSDFGG